MIISANLCPILLGDGQDWKPTADPVIGEIMTNWQPRSDLCLLRSNLARRLTGLKTHSRIWSPVKIRQIEFFCLFRPNRAWGLIGLKTVSNSNRPFDCSSNDGFTAERWKWMKNDTPERSVNRPFCHQSVNPTFSVRVWKKQIRSGNLEKRGWKLTKWPAWRNAARADCAQRT